jgi:hypothetical protein
LRLDVATKEAAEAVAQALSGNTTLLHLMMGGPVPEHVLSFIGATLSSNTLSRLASGKNEDSPGAGLGAMGNSPHAASGDGSGGRKGRSNSEEHQQLRWEDELAAEEAAAEMGQRQAARGGSSEGLGRIRGSPRALQRPESADGRGPRGRVLVRSTTQQARRLSALDPTGLAGLAGGGAAYKAAEVFRKHDSDASGYLDAEEMMAALQDLGMLEGMKAKHLGKEHFL